MSHLRFYNLEGLQPRAVEPPTYNQAVRMDNQIWVSGQGGWDRKTGRVHPDIGAQIDQAFENVDFVLKTAGGTGWEQVVMVKSYHVGLTPQVREAMRRNVLKWMPSHQALWTTLRVARLGSDEMQVELEVVAHDPR